MKFLSFLKMLKPLIDDGKNHDIEFIYNGEADYMITYKKASIQYDTQGNPYVLLSEKKAE